MTQIHFERAFASITTLRKVVANAKPILMVWPRESQSRVDPVLVDVRTAQKLCAVYQQLDAQGQSTMERLVAARQASFETLYRQLFNGNGDGETVGEPMLIELVSAYRAIELPVEAIQAKPSGLVARAIKRIKSFWQTSQQLTA